MHRLLRIVLPLPLCCALTSWALEPAVLGGLGLPSLYGPACNAVPYTPVPVYQSPGGLRIGKLVLDHPEYARETRENCSFVPQVVLQPEGLNSPLPVDGIEVQQKTPAMAVYETRRNGDRVWYRGQAENGSFWVPATGEPYPSRYFSYERHLAMGVALVSERCDDRGRCQPTPASLQDLAEQAGTERRTTCYGNAYDFDGALEDAVVTLPQGRRAYRVRLAPELALKYAGKLPAELLVPTYDYRGRWTGFFDPRGC